MVFRGTNMPDIFALVNRIKALDSRMDSIKAKSELVMAKRNELALETANSLIANFIGIRNLMIACQCDEFDPAWNEPKEVLEGMLHNCHITRDTFVPTDTARTSAMEHQMDPTFPDEVDIESSEEQRDVIVQSSDSNQSFMQNSFQRSAKQSGFHAVEAPTPPVITEDDFQGVPTHVRGRCLLSDVQRVLQKLREGFQKHLAQQTLLAASRRKKKGGAVAGGKLKAAGAAALSEFSMTAQQLEAAGCKVCGQTGMCVLKSLQRLGYVDLAKRGDVVTLMHAACDDIIYAQSQQKTTN
jgi:hypothetical protein